MKLIKNKNVSIALLLVAIATILFLAALIVCAIINKSNPILISFYCSFFAFDVVITTIYAFKTDKIHIQTHCKLISIYNLCIGLILWFLIIVLSLLSITNDVLFYITASILVLMIAARIYLFFSLSKNYSKDTTGYVLFRYMNHINIIYDIIIFAGIVVCFFIKSYIVAIFVEPPTSIEQIPSGIFIADIIYIVLSLVGLFAIIFFSILLYISGKENKSLDFQHKFKSSLKLIHKYRLGFAFGIAGNVIMLLFAIITTLFINDSYLILVFLFSFIILIKIPEFYWNKALEKKYKGEQLFKRKHQISLYASLFFIAYSILSSILGNASVVGANNGSNHSLVVTSVVFAPYALGKFVSGIIGIRNTKKSKDPVIEIEAFTKGIVALYTVNNLFLVLTQMTASPILFIISIILIIGTFIYTIGIGAYIFIVSILGLAGKRKDECEVFINYRKTKENSDIIEEEISGS